MRLSVVFLLVLLIGFLTLTSGEEEKGLQPHLRVRRGFGCPFNMRCFRHCKRRLRRRGGYCGGRFKLTCICVR
uniref:Putative tick defensins 1 n=1 Tax=Amblyomma triste TaxID=251400 RepID=A0A023GBQ6_AMBTT